MFAPPLWAAVGVSEERNPLVELSVGSQAWGQALGSPASGHRQILSGRPDRQPPPSHFSGFPQSPTWIWDPSEPHAWLCELRDRS